MAREDQLWERAMALGITGISSRSSRTALVRAIQCRMGQVPCFASEMNEMCSRQCEWAADCLAPVAVWRRH